MPSFPSKRRNAVLLRLVALPHWFPVQLAGMMPSDTPRMSMIGISRAGLRPPAQAAAPASGGAAPRPRGLAGQGAVGGRQVR